jgi:hypothetical protein
MQKIPPITLCMFFVPSPINRASEISYICSLLAWLRLIKNKDNSGHHDWIYGTERLGPFLLLHNPLYGSFHCYWHAEEDYSAGTKCTCTFADVVPASPSWSCKPLILIAIVHFSLPIYLPSSYSRISGRWWMDVLH